MKTRIIFLLLIVFSNACNSNSDDTARYISDRYNKAMAGYQGADIKIAEKALVDFIRALSRAKAKHPEALEYGSIEGFVRLRLSGIYKEQGNIDMKDIEMNNAARLLHDRLGEEVSESKRKEQLEIILHELENSIPPKWKLNDL